MSSPLPSIPLVSPLLLILISLPLFFLLFRDAFLRSSLRNTTTNTPVPAAPHTLPLFGNALLFLRPRPVLLRYLTAVEHAHPHRTLAIRVPTVGVGALVQSPANVDFVLRSPATFAKGSFFTARSWDLFGHGIINVDGPLWKAQRRAGLAFLSVQKLRVLTEVALPGYIEVMCRELLLPRKGAWTGVGTGVVDLQSVFHGLTTRLMGRMAYGMEMSAEDEFTQCFEHASGVTARRFQNPAWKVTEFLFGWRFRRSVRVVKEFGRRIVEQAIEAREKAGRSPVVKSNEEVGEESLAAVNEVEGSLVRSLLDSIGDEQLVADAALNYLSAGRDTTAQALTWTFYLLLQEKHSHVVTKIRDEIEHVIQMTDHGHGKIRDIDTRLFTPNTAPYILAVFYEAIRLYPPIPVEIKQVTRPTTLPDGTFLPKDAIVLWSPWSMSRSFDTWGPDAEDFKPERWLGPATGQETGRPFKFANRPSGEFPVFNGGPRICLGKKMAEMVAVQVIAAVAWRFSLTPAWDVGKERRSPISLTLPMEGGLPCVVCEREA